MKIAGPVAKRSNSLYQGRGGSSSNLGVDRLKMFKSWRWRTKSKPELIPCQSPQQVPTQEEENQIKNKVQLFFIPKHSWKNMKDLVKKWLIFNQKWWRWADKNSSNGQRGKLFWKWVWILCLWGVSKKFVTSLLASLARDKFCVWLFIVFITDSGLHLNNDFNTKLAK